MNDIAVTTRLELDRSYARWLGGLSAHTARGYRRDLAAWHAWCVDAGVDPGRATGRDLAEHLAGMGGSDATKARRCSAVRSFYRWARDEGLTDADPQPTRAQTPRVRGLDAARLVGLTDGQARALLAVADAHSDRAAGLIALLLTTGLRISEALSVDELDRRRGGLVVATVLGKGRKTRTVVVPPLAAERCERLGRPLFTTRTGRRLSTREAHKLVRLLGRRAGLERLHPHLLRHTAATVALVGGANISAVQEMLGHASLGTTQRYLRAAGVLTNTPAHLLAAAFAPAEEVALEE